MFDHNKIIEKSTVQYLSSIILHAPLESAFLENYPCRIEQAESFLDTGLKEALSEKDYKEVESIINTFIADMTDIYFSMGMKTGARLKKRNELLKQQFDKQK